MVTAKFLAWLPNMMVSRCASKPGKVSILACGGYENDDAMKPQYFEAQPVYPVYLGNTGDGIKWRRKPAPDSGICGTSMAATVLSFPSCRSRFAMSGPVRATRTVK